MITVESLKDYVCESCGAKTKAVYRKEAEQENGTEKDMFVCIECYCKLSRENTNKKSKGTR